VIFSDSYQRLPDVSPKSTASNQATAKPHLSLLLDAT
jgi:hypothetical protein